MKVEEKESGKGITNGLTMTVTVDGNTVSGTDWNSKNNKNPYEIDDAKKLTINNSRKISITGTKTWKDQNNACNRRPDAADPKKVVLTVLANGKQVTPQPKVIWDTTNDGTGSASSNSSINRLLHFILSLQRNPFRIMYLRMVRQNRVLREDLLKIWMQQKKYVYMQNFQEPFKFLLQ